MLVILDVLEDMIEVRNGMAIARNTGWEWEDGVEVL